MSLKVENVLLFNTKLYVCIYVCARACVCVCVRTHIRNEGSISTVQKAKRLMKYGA